MSTPKNPLGNFQVIFDIDIDKYGHKTAIVLARIRRRCDGPKGYCWESIPNMAVGLGMNEKTVRNIINKLEDASEIVCRQQPGRSSHIFISTPTRISTPTKNGTTTPTKNGTTQETKEETIHDTKVVVPKRYLEYAISQGAKHPEKYARACFDRRVLEKGRDKDSDSEESRQRYVEGEYANFWEDTS